MILPLAVACFAKDLVHKARQKGGGLAAVLGCHCPPSSFTGFGLGCLVCLLCTNRAWVSWNLCIYSYLPLRAINYLFANQTCIQNHLTQPQSLISLRGEIFFILEFHLISAFASCVIFFVDCLCCSAVMFNTPTNWVLLEGFSTVSVLSESAFQKNMG